MVGKWLEEGSKLHPTPMGGLTKVDLINSSILGTSGQRFHCWALGPCIDLSQTLGNTPRPLKKIP